MGLGLTLLLTGGLVGSAAAGWKMRFSQSPIFWALIGSGVILCNLSIWLVRLDGKRARKREEDFLNKLKVITDDLTMPYAEDRLEDLCLLYDEGERKDILDRLERMQKGQRKLRVVLEQMEKDNV